MKIIYGHPLELQMICIGRDRYDDFNYDLQLMSSDKYTDKISDALTINQMYIEECHGEHHNISLHILNFLTALVSAQTQ